MKKILYIDMDNVLVDFPSAFEKVDKALLEAHQGNEDDIPNIFSLMEPLSGAIESYRELSGLYDTYILSTAPWQNPSAWSDKVKWVQLYLGEEAYKRLIITHHKNLNSGHFLIDDRTKNGVEGFEGKHLHFGQKPFENWEQTTAHLKELYESYEAHKAKYEALKEAYNIDEKCETVINEGPYQVVYDISDEEGNRIWIDFNLINRDYTVIVDMIGEGLQENEMERF